MSGKNENPNIRCRVASCAYHCDGCDCCSLEAIQVEPCRNCHDGKSKDETHCATYKQI